MRRVQVPMSKHSQTAIFVDKSVSFKEKQRHFSSHLTWARGTHFGEGPVLAVHLSESVSPFARNVRPWQHIYSTEVGRKSVPWTAFSQNFRWVENTENGSMQNIWNSTMNLYYSREKNRKFDKVEEETVLVSAPSVFIGVMNSAVKIQFSHESLSWVCVFSLQPFKHAIPPPELIEFRTEQRLTNYHCFCVTWRLFPLSVRNSFVPEKKDQFLSFDALFLSGHQCLSARPRGCSFIQFPVEPKKRKRKIELQGRASDIYTGICIYMSLAVEF